MGTFPPERKNHVPVKTYIRPDQAKAIRLEAAERGIPDSQVFREAIDQYFKKKPG
jgi:hypothetical protein